MHIPSPTAWAVALGYLSAAHGYNVPAVKISNGTVHGSTSDGVDTFSGIPFAQPPVGELRFRPAVALNTSFDTINATGTPRACPQLPTNVDPRVFAQVPPADIAPYYGLTSAPISAGEDCLTLNVQRPSSATTTSKLPVLFWIYGGGFNTGSTQDNDWANFVAESTALGHPILVVQANYRVSAFGFLAGSEVQAEGSTNVGLRDQRLAMKWVAENIEAFGGDPDRVTIWGESAGAVSATYHMLIEGGDNEYKGKPLFHAAMMDSGSSVPAGPVDGAAAQGVFDAIAEAGGCATSGREHHHTTSYDRLACLRALPYDKLLNATNAAPSLLNYHGIALSFVARPDPKDSFFPVSAEQAIWAKKIARVPIITGNQADEGTLFALALYNGTTTNSLIDRHLRSVYPTTPRSILKKLIDMYSTDPAKGSPYDTGDANRLYPNFKRNAALIGDTVFVLQRRHQLEHTSELSNAWSFSAVYDRSAGTLGTGHGTDLALFASGTPALPYKHTLEYYISFVNYLDPNEIARKNRSSLKHWPRWTPDGRQMMQFDVHGESIIRDDFREASYRFLKSIISILKV